MYVFMYMYRFVYCVQYLTCIWSKKNGMLEKEVDVPGDYYSNANQLD